MSNVTLLMPMDSGPHPGMSGRIELLKFNDGTAVGRSDGAFNGRPVEDLRQLRILELRYGTIRARSRRRLLHRDRPHPETIHIRDSKQTGGAILTVTPTAWSDFLTYASNS